MESSIHTSAIASQILAAIKAKRSPSKGHELLLGPAYFQTFLRSGSPHVSGRFKILVGKAVHNTMFFDGTGFVFNSDKMG